MNFAQVVDQIRSSASTERQKGALFEEFIRRCWLTDPQFGRRTQNIWLWQDFPGRESLGGKDLGIDLVAEMKPEITGDNEFWAIQCKCYDKNSTIDKKAVDSFLSNAQRAFILNNITPPVQNPNLISFDLFG